MIRATTGGVLRSYRTNLMGSFIRDNKARETVLTQRVFNSYAEDPAAAAKAFRLRKSRMQASSQLDICRDAYYKYQGAFACLQKVSELIDTENGSDMATLKSTTLEWLNDPKGDARTQLSKVLDNLSETIVQNMNQTYGDDFIFAGADGQNVPFTVETDADGRKQLFYRGVPVDAAEPELKTDTAGDPIQMPNGDYVLAGAETVEKAAFQETVAGTPDTVTAENGTVYYVNNGAAPLTKAAYDALATDAEKAEYAAVPDTAVPPGDPTYYKTSELTNKEDYDKAVASAIKDTNGDPVSVTIDGKDYYVVEDDKAVMTEADYEKACENAEKLDYLMKEKRFIDIGLGLQEDEETGKLIESSAFDESIVGLKFLGYGLDADGDPKNVFSIVQRLKDISESVPEGGSWDAAWPEFDRLVGKLETAADSFKTQFTNHSAASTKLENNVDLLEDNVYNLKEQYSNLEDVNMADAISSFIWAEYCYNAALKVGNSILSQSLMDYLQ